MAETDTQNSTEVVSGITKQPVSAQTIRDIMARVERNFVDITDLAATVAQLLKDAGVSQSIGAEETRDYLQKMDVIARLVEINAESRAARKAMRRREKHLAKLAAELGEPEDVVFEKALAFFKDAIEAERRGDQVVIVNKDYDILTELSGFMSGVPSSH